MKTKIKLTELQRAVIRQLGFDKIDNDCIQVLIDVTKHGAACGFGSFIYYKDTKAFYNVHKELIWELLEQGAEDMGEDIMTYIAGFQSKVNSLTDFENLLSWYALEEVARQLINE